MSNHTAGPSSLPAVLVSGQNHAAEVSRGVALYLKLHLINAFSAIVEQKSDEVFGSFERASTGRIGLSEAHEEDRKELYSAWPAILPIVQEGIDARRSWSSYYYNPGTPAELHKIIEGTSRRVDELHNRSLAFFSKNYEILMKMGKAQRLKVIDEFVAELMAKVQFESSEWAELAKTTDITPAMKERLNSAYEAMEITILDLGFDPNDLRPIQIV